MNDRIYGLNGRNIPGFRLGKVTSGRTMSVLDALSKKFPIGISAYETTPYINDVTHMQSVGTPLNPGQMRSLKDKVDSIVQDFETKTSGSNLRGEQLQLAKIVYIYNYILGNVKYANMIHANDGTACVINRPEDRVTNYDSGFSALVLRSSICCGISDAIYLLCKKMGIECEKWLWPDGGHAFNKVKIGDTWYKLDATFPIGFYPYARAEAWDTNYLLTETDQPFGNIGAETSSFPRNRIDQMKTFLEGRGVSFDYSPPPKIRFRTSEEALNTLVNSSNENVDHKEKKLEELHKFITSFNLIPKLKILGINEKKSNLDVDPIVYFVPDDKKITIQVDDCKMTIASNNNSYIVSNEYQNTQETRIIDENGNLYPIRLGQVHYHPNQIRLGQIHEHPNQIRLGRVHYHPNQIRLGRVHEHPDQIRIGQVHEHPGQIHGNFERITIHQRNDIPSNNSERIVMGRISFNNRERNSNGRFSRVLNIVRNAIFGIGSIMRDSEEIRPQIIVHGINRDSNNSPRVR